MRKKTDWIRNMIETEIRDLENAIFHVGYYIKDKRYGEALDNGKFAMTLVKRIKKTLKKHDAMRGVKRMEAVYDENGPDVSIRKVKVLQGRLREQADKRGLKPDDLVLVKTIIKPHQPPIYEIEKVEGDPVLFLLKKAGRGG